MKGPIPRLCEQPCFTSRPLKLEIIHPGTPPLAPSTPFYRPRYLITLCILYILN